MNDMSAVIVPRSDQMNSDDLLAGPRTITITEVSIRPGTEQPVSISFVGDNGKPFKPCKSMSRCLVAAWGPDANAYIGRSATLYLDPSVKWGGMAVGGIRISHLSDIERDMVLALTETKGKKKIHKVSPLRVAQKAPDQPQEQKRRTWSDILPEIEAELNACESEDAVHEIVGRDLIKKGLEKADSPQAQRLNAMIKSALDRFAEPITDDDAPHWSDDPTPAPAAA